MLDHDEVLSRVIPAVAESLSVDTHEVQRSQTYFVDLDGDSIAWLDLSFRLDKEFRVRIPGLNSLGGVETDAEGRFTQSGVDSLRAFMPGALIDRVKARLPSFTAKEMVTEITIDDIARMVELALKAKNAAVPG